MKTKKLMILLQACTLMAVFLCCTGRESNSGDQDIPAKLQAEFLELKFGMFIHFNMETYLDVQWVAGYHSPAVFNPGVETIDTDAWADAAKAAGMKYGVLTVKHVSGFCLWDSRYTTYDVMHPDCPYQKDLVAQFIESFTSRGLKAGLYYCWRHPGFGEPEKYKVLPPECDPSLHTLQEQIAFQQAQIAELLEKYPDVFYIWNDALDSEIMPAEEAMAFYNGLPRRVLVSANWWDWAKKGEPYADIAVTETREFPGNNTTPGETCWTLEDSWFWSEGTKTKEASSIMPYMVNANARKANFLLNAGPDKSGRLSEASIRVLNEIGKLSEGLHP